MNYSTISLDEWKQVGEGGTPYWIDLEFNSKYEFVRIDD